MPEFIESDHPRDNDGKFSAGESGSTGLMNPADIVSNPDYQFKLDYDPKTGLVNPLEGEFDSEQAGTLNVWKNPKDGKTYITHGFHRLDLAKRSGTKLVKVEYLPSEDVPDLVGRLQIKAWEKEDQEKKLKITSDSRLAFDFTARTYDANGWLRISRSHISKASVNPYYGREIPGADSLGLEPDKIYYLLRAPEELAKGADTFKNCPILSKHTPLTDFATWGEKEKKKYIVGSIGSDVEFLEPYLDADTCIWDADAIAGIETDQVREFSCSYRYVPIMTTGTYNGQKYDGIMTQIQANHLALVESGRAGAEVLAADSKIERKQPMIRTKLGNALIVALTTAFPKVQVAQDSALEKILAPATRQAFDKAGAKTLILAMDADMPAKEKEVDAVMDALVDVDDPKPSKKDEDEKRAADKKAADKKAADKRAADASGHPEGCMCKDCKTARDEKPEDEEKDKKAMDEMGKMIRAEIREAEEAKRAVRPIVGEIFAQDSAAEIYGFALDHLKVDRAGVEGTRALQALFHAASKPNTTPAAPHLAMDSNTAEKMFPNLARIRQG